MAESHSRFSCHPQIPEENAIMNIPQALAKLDPANDEHWTADGMPRVDVVAELVNNAELKRSDITSAAPDFTRASAKVALPEGEADEEKRGFDPEAEKDNGFVEAELPPTAAAILAIPAPVAPQEAPVAPEATTDAPGDADPASALLRLEGELAELETHMYAAQGKATSAKDEADKAANAVNAMNRRIEVLQKADPNHGTSGIRAYLKQQNASRLARAGRVLRFLGNAEVTPAEALKALNPRAPIDAALNVRKGARGTARPVRTPAK